jgi:hypothetical protein
MLELYDRSAAKTRSIFGRMVGFEKNFLAVILGEEVVMTLFLKRKKRMHKYCYC